MNEEFGRAVRRLRRRIGITQAELSRRSQLPQSTISRLETGVMLPGTDTLLDVARGLGVTPNEIFKAAGIILPEDDLTLWELYEIAAVLTPVERQRVTEYAEWRLHEQREQSNATSDDPRQVTGSDKQK